jgi:hypothetical protein
MLEAFEETAWDKVRPATTRHTLGYRLLPTGDAWLDVVLALSLAKSVSAPLKYIANVLADALPLKNAIGVGIREAHLQPTRHVLEP